jgi:four helix bundle protein
MVMRKSLLKVYDLEERAYQFSRAVAGYLELLPKSLSNDEYSKQLIRSSSSIGANYIEANEALGKKDFRMRVRISRKEAKESAYWLRLILETNNVKVYNPGKELFDEAIELKKIPSSIILKSE